MAVISCRDAANMAYRGIWNHLSKRPLVISFETTLSCNCNCLHCDLGGGIKDEKQIGPGDYARITRLFQPPAVQISGGEPLLRKDIVDIVKAIKQSSPHVYLIFVTNGALLNEEKYLELQEAGVNQFSVSLDFPDNRHDQFRRKPGLYEHLERTLPQLSSLGSPNIILNSVITKINLKDIIPLAFKAKEWHVSISYSIYTPRRTGSREFCIDSEDDLELLRNTIHQLIELKKQLHTITNLPSVLQDTLKFIEQGYYMENCSAGIGFLVVNPSGILIPCSLYRDKEFTTQQEMKRQFSSNNKCGDCLVSIRSYSEQSPLNWLINAPAYIRQFVNNKNVNTSDIIPQEIIQNK